MITREFYYTKCILKSLLAFAIVMVKLLWQRYILLEFFFICSKYGYVKLRKRISVEPIEDS